MLHLETVFPATWELLKNLMALEELSEFNLAGGTSLSLQIGHRFSVDLDFFGTRPFDAQEILDLVLLQKADWQTVKKTIQKEVKKIY
jgi:hypothetical protein